MKTVTAEDVRVALSAGDPASRITLSTVDATAAVRRARPSPALRRLWAVWATAVAAVVAVSIPAGAVATDYVARTGWFGSPDPGGAAGGADSTESDDTEWLDLGAADLPEVVASLYPERLPLAPGVTRQQLTDRVVAEMSRMDGLAQETLVRKTYEYEAYRDWIGAWISANDQEDRTAAATAASVLEDAAGWPATVETDGGGITDLMRAYARRIASGDRDAAQALAQLENAPGWDGIDRSDVHARIAADTLGADR
jgi:hypothetical protein